MSNMGLVFVRKLNGKTILVTVLDTEAVTKLKPESQHAVVVQTGENMTTVSIFHDTHRDRTEEAHGNGIDGILELSIWQN